MTKASTQQTPPRSRRGPLLLLVLAVVVALAAVAFIFRPTTPVLHVHTILRDAAALRPGANVTLAGIEVGTVESITLTDAVRADVAKRLHTASDQAACERERSSRACGVHFEATHVPY